MTKIQREIFTGSPLVKIYGKTNSYAQTYANAYSIPFVSLGIAEGTTEPALLSFIGKDPGGFYYQYRVEDFNNAFLAYQLNPQLPATKMYLQFLNGQCKFIALEDAAKLLQETITNIKIVDKNGNIN